MGSERNQIQHWKETFTDCGSRNKLLSHSKHQAKIKTGDSGFPYTLFNLKRFNLASLLSLALQLVSSRESAEPTAGVFWLAVSLSNISELLADSVGTRSTFRLVKM